jgi:hypothetical protein
MVETSCGHRRSMRMPMLSPVISVVAAGAAEDGAAQEGNGAVELAGASASAVVQQAFRTITADQGGKRSLHGGCPSPLVVLGLSGWGGGVQASSWSRFDERSR